MMIEEKFKWPGKQNPVPSGRMAYAPTSLRDKEWGTDRSSCPKGLAEGHVTGSGGPERLGQVAILDGFSACPGPRTHRNVTACRTE